VPIWEDTLGICIETPLWHITIQALDIQLAGHDPFGQLVGARLRLSCNVLLQVTMASTKTGSYMLFGDQEVGPEHLTKYDTDLSDCTYYIWDEINRYHVPNNRTEVDGDEHIDRREGYYVFALPLF
jgi:hypothetical protein